MISKDETAAIDTHAHIDAVRGKSKNAGVENFFGAALSYFEAPGRSRGAKEARPGKHSRRDVVKSHPLTQGVNEFLFCGAFMVTLPNLRHLLAAMEVSRAGSVSKAAKRIHLSQSAVTQAVSGLENYLGIPLFNRTATGMLTTAAGHVFLKRVARGYQWLNAIEQLTTQKSMANPGITRLITLSQLRALIAVVETESYTRAASQLKVTQPTVHRAIRELNALFHQPLFERSPQGVVPCWQARQLARYASLFFTEIVQGIEEVNEYQGRMKGSICIGALPLSRTRIVPSAVTKLLAEFPEVKVRIVDGPYEEQLHALLHGQIDMIVGALRHPVPSPDIIQERLFLDHLNIVVRPGHWLTAKKKVTPQELRRVDWIAPKENTPAREAFREVFRREGIEPPTRVIECSSLTAIRGLLLESDRAALLPARQVEIDVNCGLLAVSPVPLTGTAREIGVTLRRDWQPTKIQQQFLTWLKADS